ncbi:PaaI family thioesterase [Rhodobacteraceae bacterium N5(2021)]|uniref:PaaI family thioesterase n=1 Tax=Gymnodinialimonas phycosphaerae TaxID=2841589 RepID=A0A975TVS6_9RHOB|nr:PaaI family thioesterase [Gymnodinialimonas phycosphaerae]MBY4895067.1 PaaI family thioesterase [Gymnodinialimonas phycosphaerae]
MPTPYYAQSPNDLPTEAEVLALSGLEFMRAIAAGEISNPPIGETLGYNVDQVEDGRVVFRGTPTFGALNPMGTVHGGWYGTLLDSAMACAVMTKVPKGSVYTTLEYKVNITRPIPMDAEIIAEGIVSHAGRSTGVAEGTIRDAASGKLYATGSTTCLIMARTITPNT